MNKILKVVAVIALWLFALSSLGSGRTVGNGGNIVICNNIQGKSYEVLDFYEAHLLRQTSPDFFEVGNSINDKIYFILNRLEKISPLRAQMYKEYFKNFFNEVQWISEGELSPISDSDNIIKPPLNCEIKQTVNQNTPVTANDKRYFIDKKVWNALDLNQQAGLVLHEIIYREAISIGHTNSVSARYLNGFICSNRMNTISVMDFTALLKQLDFTTNTIQGFNVNLQLPFSFYNSGTLKEAHLSSSAIISEKQQSMKIAPYKISFYDNGQIEHLTLDEDFLYENALTNLTLQGVVEFYKNGLLKQSIAHGHLAAPLVFKPQVAEVSGPIKYSEDNIPLDFNLVNPIYFYGLRGQVLEIVGRVQIDTNGQVQSFYLHQKQNLTVQGNIQATALPFSEVKLNNKKIKSFMLASPVTLMTQKKIRQQFSSGSLIVFDENGLVLQ